MRKQQIVICDTNHKYAERLQEYWEEERSVPCSVVFYTDWELCKEYLLSHAPTVCVISEDLYEEADVLRSADNVVQCWEVLCEEKRGMPENGIFRYRSGDVILREICEKAGIKWQANSDRDDSSGMKLIGIYTPVGRCLQTSFALVLGQMLASKYRVLYLNFEAYSGFSRMMQKNFQADMAELLFFHKNLSKDFFRQFAGMKESINGMDYIPPAFSYMDISAILPEEWEQFFKVLEEMGEYDYLILDLTDYVQGLYRILRNCSHVYTITRNEERALAKIEHYELVLKELAYEDVLKKTRKCTMPLFRQLPVEAENLLYSELADYTRKILREDFDFT